MFCPKCGNELNEEAVFCAKCGAKISSAGVSASTNNSRKNNGINTGDNVPRSSVTKKPKKVAVMSLVIVIISGVFFIAANFLPLYSIKGEFIGETASFNTVYLVEKTDTAVLGVGVFIYVLLIASAVSNKILHLIFSVFSSMGLLYIINWVRSGIAYKSMSLGGETIVGGGTVGGMGYYALIVSVICLILSVVVHFLEAKENPSVK